jgi:hypothetical protein
MIAEFIDTYSDDLLYLIDSRRALLTHPLRTEVKELCDAAFCRLLAVFMVGNIEAMLKYWMENHGIKEFKEYFDRNTPNGKKIQILLHVFKKHGIHVDKEILENYLAIKYLRNIIVHARWNPNERNWLERKGFPTDTRKLTEEHWHKMLEVNQNMMMYIALTGIPELKRRLSDDKVLRIKLKKEEPKPMIIKRKDLPHLIYRNLENIAAELHNSISKAATSEKYNWSKAITLEDLEKLTEEECKLRYYTAAKEAGREGFYEGLNCVELMNDALYFWNLYAEETFAKSGITENEVKESLRTLMELHKRKSYPEGPFAWNEKSPKEIKLMAVKNFIKNCNGLFEEEIIRSLDEGKLVYGSMPNITPVTLFAVYFPVITPENARSLANEVKFILNLWKLRELWYFYVERREPPTMSKLLFYERLFDKLTT